MNTLIFNSKNSLISSFGHLMTGAIKSVHPLIWLNILLFAMLAFIGKAVSTW